MEKEQLEEIKKTVAQSIEIHVNGKIDIVTRKLDDYIKTDNEWKDRAEPVIVMGNNVRGFGKVSLYLVGFVASVAGAILALTNLFKK